MAARKQITLVTGGTGFIGSHTVRALAARGDRLRLLVRKGSDASHLDGVDFERATGSVTDRRAVSRAMEGVDRVFHVAGFTSMLDRHRDRVMDVNVAGTRTVMRAAVEAGVERAVHVSSVAAVGPAPRRGLADEDQAYTGYRLNVAYVDSKHAAETEALRAAAAGLKVVIVNPAYVLGPEAPRRTSMTLIERFLKGEIVAFVEGGLNVVDVRDVAAALLAADERGTPGERYILGGRNFTLVRLFADLARISGVDAPRLRLPGEVALRAVEAARAAGLPTPIDRDEVRSAIEWWTYRSAKAKRELGFEPRSHEQTLADAIEWQRANLGPVSERGALAELGLGAASSAFDVVNELGRVARGLAAR